jgi:hypothetical protein
VLVLATASTRSDVMARPAEAGTSTLASVPNQTQGKQGGQTQPDAAVGSGFTYQGQLKDGGNPANGQYDFQFKLYDASSGGTQVGSTLTTLNQTVTGGVYTTQLDFGAAAYQGQGRWLEIGVRVAGGPTYTTLSPRQPLNATPYASSLMPGVVVTGTASSLISAIGSGSTGLYGESTAAGGRGVTGHSGNGTGVRGTSTSLFGVEGTTGGGPTVSGISGTSTGNNGVGVLGTANTGTSAYGVAGTSTSGRGVNGSAGSGTGVWGESNSGFGVYGTSGSNWAIKGSGASGVWGDSVAGYGVSGSTGGGPSVYGVYGTSTGVDGVGVAGQAMNGTGARGVYGASANGYGVVGSTAGGASVSGVSGTSTGVNGVGVAGLATSGTNALGVWGSTTVGRGVYGSATTGTGVYGISTTGGNGVYGSASISGNGVYGISSGTGYGGYFISTNSTGLYAEGGGGLAGFFEGHVHVTGQLTCGGGCLNMIDHPLDPENKYLAHTAVQSAEMKNVYDGNVTTDAKGEAVVTLPEWFEALNKDFRYQLTILGEQFAQARVSSEVKDNRFTIKTDKPNIKVSWQVTGIRKDPYAQAHPIQVEVEKQGDERGKYLHPTEYGQPESKGVNYAERQEMERLLDPNKSQPSPQGPPNK